MANPQKVTFSNISAVLGKELEEYREEVQQAVDAASQKAALSLVQITKQTAPKRSGDFRRHIAWKEIVYPGRWRRAYVWYVKAPSHRLTHLLVHGHAKSDGDRVDGDPFLKNAMDKVIPEYEADVEDALKW